MAEPTDDTTEAPAVTADQLRERAGTLFDRRVAARVSHQQLLAQPGDALIGTAPVGPGEILTLVRWQPTRAGSATYVFRRWALSPDGDRVPLGPNMKVPASVLPALAKWIADALDRELAADTAPDGRRP